MGGESLLVIGWKDDGRVKTISQRMGREDARRGEWPD